MFKPLPATEDPGHLAATQSDDNREAPLLSLLTKIFVHSLCPILKSDILFRDIEKTSETTFPFFVQKSMTGEMCGRIGIVFEKSTLRVLVNHFSPKKTGPKETEATIHKIMDALSVEFKNLFEEEDFNCQIENNTKIEENVPFVPSPGYGILCPIETKFGDFKIFFEVQTTTEELFEMLGGLEAPQESRKIRVFASQLDMLYTQVAQVEKLEKQLLSGPHIRSKIRSQIKRLKRTVHQLKSEPVETLFSPARRMVVEIAKQQGKQVRFQTQGTWTYLDKSLLNHLYEPILHLSRNAIDHGIEEPSERERVGKPAQGTIKSIITFTSSELKILMSDDGRGLHLENILDAAITKGVISATEGPSLLQDQVATLIFEPGLSTRTHSDEISGRGLGLDIVKRSIEALGGNIRVLSTSHHGTSFEIRIPLRDSFALSLIGDTPKDEDKERTILLDEISEYLERLFRTVEVTSNTDTRASIYEAYRLVHSIKGACGFLGWNRVAGFCHYLEDVLKLISEQKLALDAVTTSLVKESCRFLKRFCEIAKEGKMLSLIDARRLEARLQQTIWGATHSDEKTYLFFGRYHLGAVQRLLATGKSGWKHVPETNFAEAIQQPYGSFVQFTGDRIGYAGILLPEKTLSILSPALKISHEAAVKKSVSDLSEFAVLMGEQITQLASETGVVLQASAPLTYYGWGEPLRILGDPTYGYECVINEKKFYLVGDFRMPQEAIAPKAIQPSPFYSPTLLIEEAMRQSAQVFGGWGLQISFRELPTQSELIGFDGGITVIITCREKSEKGTQSILFLSFEQGLARFIHSAFAGDITKSVSDADIYDCLNEAGNIIGGGLLRELEKRKLSFELSPPSVFIGKAFVANFNRLFATNKWSGNTEQGRMELQLLVTSQTKSV